MGADAVVASTRDLVGGGWNYEALVTDAHRDADRFHAELAELLASHRQDIDVLVWNHATALQERMQEARLELDLARILGPDDAKGRDAMGRAQRASSTEAGALLRVLGHLSQDADRPSVHLRLVN